MALTDKPRNRTWLRLHFLIRLLGITGLLVGGVGLALAFLGMDLSSWQVVQDSLNAGDVRAQVAVGLLAGGALVVVLALLVEIVAMSRLVAGRRSALGANVVLQITLATALLVGINAWSYQHYSRLDWTLAKLFTLPEDIRKQLTQLEGETTIVVYQRHKTFGQLSDKPDAYDYAAERKVVEKVQDLVEQFRELGRKFRVVVLDVEEEGYDAKLAALTENAAPLRTAIDNAPENSIFFYAPAADKVQRLSFNDFYLLDKTASQQANDGKGNLVLLYQGVEPFARKVLNIDEKRPTIGIGVIHEWLTTEGPEDFGMAGVKKALSARGFQVKDILLKKWFETDPKPPEPAVYTYEESKFERLEEELAELEAAIKTLDKEVQLFNELTKDWQTKPLEELQKSPLAKQIGVKKVDEEIRSAVLKRILEPNRELRRVSLEQTRKERDTVAEEKSKLNVEGAVEQRRMTDLKAKLNRLTADCDLLFIPRMTLRNVNIGDRIPSRLYRLDDSQVAAVKDFLKAGKPIFACFGPDNDPPDRSDPFSAAEPDKLEDALRELGFRFAKQTVLFNVESKSFAERRSGLLVSGANIEVPPVEFEVKPEDKDAIVKPEEAPKAPNPIRESMRITTHSLGKTLDLRVRHPRPIYFEPTANQPGAFAAEFMTTSSASWNDDQPFPTRERTPRFEPPKPDDPMKGTRDEKRRGPFPIGVAFETTLPAGWYESKDDKPATVRVAAIGHGGLFSGTELSPAKERLFLNTCNWLLGRDDLLPRADRPWQYPRVQMSPYEQSLWHWGAWLGLPALFAYLGLVVLMVRRMR